MGLFSRRSSGGNAPGSEPFAGLEVIRRIKVTVDRYWVTSQRQVDANAARDKRPIEQAGKTIDGVLEQKRDDTGRAIGE